MSSITYRLRRGDDTFELDVEYEVAAYDPGNSYGPPENCEPPSGGELEECTVTLDGQPFVLTDAENAALETWIYGHHDYSDDGYEPDFDDDDWGGD